MTEGKKPDATTPRMISLFQPWASLVAIGAKRFETRSWETKFRGTLVIHAARTKAHLALALEEPFADVLEQAGLSAATLPCGAIVGVCQLLDCVEAERSGPVLRDAAWLPTAAPHELEFGDFSPGRFAWALGQVLRIDPPIVCRGRQGLRWITPDVAAALLPHFRRASA